MEVRKDWTSDACRMKSIALDLESAYKQLSSVHASDRNKALVTLRSPVSGKAEFFLMNALPFGAVSNLIWALGCHLGLIKGSLAEKLPIYERHPSQVKVK